MKEKFHVQYLTIYAQLYYAHKDPNFGMHMDILNQLSTEWKKSSVGASREEIFWDLIEKLAPEIMSASLLKSPLGLTQTTKLISGKMKYKC